MTELTLAQRTPPTSPFYVLYEQRAVPDSAKPPGKRGPRPSGSARAKMKKLAERDNREQFLCAPNDTDKTNRILKGGM